jgi:hypothetical protein
MKKLYTILAALFLTASAFAQAPEKMSYQAVVRDSGDALVTSQPVGMQISILQTTATGTAVYVETQTPTTNVNGLVSLEIGTGNLVSGDFTSIDWSTDSYFIKTETDPTGGSSYTITGTSQLMSVPFALYAKTSGSATPGPQGAQGTQGIQGTRGDIGATGLAGATGPQGPAGAAGQGGVTQAGLGISVTGTGTVADPYIVSTKTYTIGLWPELGGYVFRISADGKHGLVAETQDQGTSNWYGTQNLMSNPGTHSTNGQKFMDWRVPTIFELTQMSNFRSAIGGFNTNALYWSSTGLNATAAYYFDFLFGAGNNGKTITYSVRGVRAF